MEDEEAGRLLRFHWDLDKDGHTVLHPLTDEDRAAMTEALKNPRGLKFGETLEERQECPIDPEIPYELSECGIAAEADEGLRATRLLARAQWEQGEQLLAQQYLDIIELAGS